MKNGKKQKNMKNIKTFEDFVNEQQKGQQELNESSFPYADKLAKFTWDGDMDFSELSKSDQKFVDQFIKRNVKTFKKWDFGFPFADEGDDFWEEIQKDKDYNKFKKIISDVSLGDIELR